MDGEGLQTLILTLLVFAPLLTGMLAFALGARGLADALGIALSLGLLLLLVPLSGTVLEQGHLHIDLGGHGGGLGIPLYVDGLTLAMLWLTAILSLSIQVYSAGWLRSNSLSADIEFRWLWFFLWSGLNALFLSGDLFNLYVTLEITTLAAVPLVILSRGRQAMEAAMRYLLYALVGSILFLLGVALTYAYSGFLSLPEISARSINGSVATAALLLMTAGTAMKAALFPVHGWLPRAHSTAPSPASALLSAIVAKAGAYLLIRLWMGPFEQAWNLPMAQAMGAVGAAGIFFASFQALRQTRLKLVIAYSTVAQLGYLLLLIPLATLMAWNGVIYHALSHGLAKAALFLAAGNLIMAIGNDRLESLAGCDRILSKNIMAIGLAGVAIAGLPPSGGFIAKWWMIQSALQSGQWWWAAVISTGGLMAALYIFRILAHAFHAQDPYSHTPRHHAGTTLSRWLVWPPVLLALAAIALGVTGNLLAPFIEAGSPLGGQP
ncbi:complex I subunit 5 family protein [Natronospira bacteriovora]|uniref:Proton-conducting transporter membrane subunit n=1 Tax=Natronospira bacteriovora TaxID=3069753 RepID=A0ABU0W9I1_9GAMM|nr:proton-conducting transporter membrane subunit [Natronospira sp. AB-CW4]MDQ2070692.1 proton-conducting transporter membrane subunit [Natronospira sp. AB-CW4]